MLIIALSVAAITDGGTTKRTYRNPTPTTMAPFQQPLSPRPKRLTRPGDPITVSDTLTYRKRTSTSLHFDSHRQYARNQNQAVIAYRPE